MPRLDFTFPACWTAVLALAFVPACGKKEPPAPAEAPPPKSTPAPDVQAGKDLSKKVESFTGARTRVVWAQNQKQNGTDPLSNKSAHFLMGMDSHDGLGVRPVIAKEGNYTRPIITSDGDTILYTRKSVTWDAQDTRHYSTVVMRTDWKGSAPVEISDGYAVDAWRDQATRIEWVYAVRDIMPSPLIALEAKKLIRFQLENPEEEQLVWDQTRVSPDNIQFSRDGKRASGQFPWPNTGQFIFEGKNDFKKLLTGCWPSMAPDNSYVSWILDGAHKSITLFPDDGGKPWTVGLTTTPELAKGEIYHPCWTNHPRFITLTGPYLPAADPEEGSAIGKGGLTSEVFIGKFSEKLDKIDAWLRITDNALNDNYPDIWIEGGDTAELKSFAQTHESKSAPPAAIWPLDREGIVFLWQNRDANNAVKLPNGTQLDCSLDAHGAARHGRSFEMLLDTGSFVPKADAAAIIKDALFAGMPLTLEFILHIDGDAKAAFGNLATFPHLKLSIRDGTISAETSSGIIGIGPVQGSVNHFTAAVGEKGYSFTLQEIDGKSTTKTSAAKPRQSQGRSDQVVFGGGSGKGIGMSHVAVYARALSAAEMRDHAKPLSALAVASSPPSLKLRAKLVETSPMPTAEGISPYASALVEYVYEVSKVIEGEYAGKRIFVKHWAMMDRKPVLGFPRKVGVEYDLAIQPLSAHPQLKGDRSMPLDVLDLDPWYDVTTPVLGR
jgi:hypothetical protein